ncbi:MAG: ribonuclease E/G [Alphaproteobacteria bacterium]
MTKRILIDAEYLEETRVVVTNESEIEDFDHETTTKKQNRGNLYLAKIARVEPSLQAAFVDYGNERHGFLAFSEIHPDYFQIPIADKENIIQKEVSDIDDNDIEVESIEEAEINNNSYQKQKTNSKIKFYNKYKIQEVIKKGQIVLIQVTKEERGNKGAALTTFISLAGRYCVLMTNTIRKGGISRRITHSNDRKKLRSIIESLDIPNNMAVIVRTAGSKRTKVEIKRDYNFLNKTWENIKQNTLKSVAPALIHEENNIIKRGIRDLYTPEIEEILIQGDSAFKAAKTYMKTLIPSKIKILKEYKEKTPLLQKYNIDTKLEKIHSPIANLKSGGYIVINQTEALVAVDVNSGKATKERNIEETALQTNKEAAEELAIQLRLRDMSGLIVIDFIDMVLSKNNRFIENVLKQRLYSDRAKIQVGNISSFGLLEMSRQRLRPSIYEAEFITCPHCLGQGRVRSLESLTLKSLHDIEKQATNYSEKSLTINIPAETALHILNNKRKELSNIEAKRNITINIVPDENLKNEENILDKNHTSNEIKTKTNQNNKNETNNKNTNKIKRPNNKKKFNKFNVKNNENKDEKFKNNENETNNVEKTKQIKDNKNETNNKEKAKQIKDNKNEKKASRKKLNTSSKDSIQNSKPSTIKEKPIKTLTKAKEENIKNKVIKSTKVVKPRKKGPIKKGWWNKEEV